MRGGNASQRWAGVRRLLPALDAHPGAASVAAALQTLSCCRLCAWTTCLAPAAAAAGARCALTTGLVLLSDEDDATAGAAGNAARAARPVALD
jgi:hypothetical protein